MAFRLEPGKSVSSELRRIVLAELDAAASELTAIGDPQSDEAIHVARRHVKKLRAVIRLVRPGRDEAYRGVDKDLRHVSRLLAPVADGQGIIVTLDEIAHRYRGQLPKRVVAAIRAGLVERAVRTDRQACVDRVLQISAATLRAERGRVKDWPLRSDGFDTIEAGLEAGFRRARKAMLAARDHPTVARYHHWRQLVKNHWFHVRLLEGCCGDQLVADQRRLEVLDGILGEYHNLVLLREVLGDDQYVSRADTTRCLHLVAGYQQVLRQQAQPLGMTIYGEKPRGFVRRIKHLWKQCQECLDSAPHAL